MNDFQLAYNFTRTAEGGWVNDPNDAETMGGINRRYHPNWGGWSLVDALRQDNSPFAMKKATQTPEIEAAIKKFYKNWWIEYKCGQLNTKLSIALFDTTFMSDEGVWLLQRAVNFVAGEKLIEEDNDIGQHTIDAANSASSELVYIYMLKRIKYQVHLSNKRPYYRGWADRTAKLGLYIYKQTKEA